MIIKEIISGMSESIYKEFGSEFKIYTEAERQGLKAPCFFISCRKTAEEEKLEEFKWGVEEYAQKARENGDGRWAKELENASARVHITKLEALRKNMQNTVREMTVKNEGAAAKELREVYDNIAYKSAYEMQRAYGNLSAFAQVSEKQIEKALEKPWTSDGKTFSDRLWKDQEALVNAVDKVINKNLLLGSSLDKMTTELTQKIVNEMGIEVEKARKRAERIIRTETARIRTEASLESMKEQGCEKVKISAALDMTTCDVCGSYDGQIVEVKDAEIGRNVPPFHPNCRCCIIPYNDNKYFKEGGKRAARDPETGKTVYADDMSYEEWKEKYVEKDIAKSGESGIIKKNNVESGAFVVHTVGKIDKKIYSCITDDIITDDVIITDERINHIKERHPNDYERFCSYIPEIIANPDYIIEANKPKTAFVLKEIIDENERFQLILRLTTSEDITGYSNSVITFLKISDKKWNKYLRNKKILYKKE